MLSQKNNWRTVAVNDTFKKKPLKHFTNNNNNNNKKAVLIWRRGENVCPVTQRSRQPEPVLCSHPPPVAVANKSKVNNSLDDRMVYTL